MADQSDVADAIVLAIQEAIYPNGLSGDGGPSIPVAIYAGWPEADQLQEDLALGRQDGPEALHVSVFPTGAERSTTRYESGEQEVSRATATFTLTAIGQTITVGGGQADPYAAQNLCVFVNRRGYVHQALPGQSLAAIASALRDLIAADVPGTTVAGPAITVPSTARIGALRVGVFGTVVRNVGQQEKNFQVSLWADSDENRTYLAKLVIPILADTIRVPLPDGTVATLRHVGGTTVDKAQRVRVYQRHILIAAEYSTTITTDAPELVVAITDYFTKQGDFIAHTET